MDKFILLTYTYIAADGLRHSGHAWFETEKEMKDFIKKSEVIGIETDVAIEILSYRELNL